MCRRVPFSFLLFQSFQLILGFALHNGNSNSNSNTTEILQDVLKEISAKEKWDLDRINISRQEVSKVRFGISRRPEFRIQHGKTRLHFTSPYQVDSWNKLNVSGNDDFGDFVKKACSFALLDTFQLKGPFDLRVNGEDQLSLSLPLNTSHGGLKRVLVGKGITVEVRKAQEILLYDTLDLRNQNVKDKRRTGFWPFWDCTCTWFHPLNIIGSASLVAQKDQNPDSAIKTTFLSANTVELLSDKCYNSSEVCNIRARPVHSLSFRMARLEKILRNFLGDRMSQNGMLSFLRTNLRASTIIRFQLELEKNVAGSDTDSELLAGWRAKPTVERVWFEVTAKVDGQKLKPLIVKRVRPFIAVDSVSWSTLTSNISFTNLPSILAPPEPLTLDVRW